MLPYAIVVIVEMEARINRNIQTKGTSFRKGEVVTVEDYPEMMGLFYVDHCTVRKEGYGLVRLFKSDVEVI